MLFGSVAGGLRTGLRLSEGSQFLLDMVQHSSALVVSHRLPLTRFVWAAVASVDTVMVSASRSGSHLRPSPHPKH